MRIAAHRGTRLDAPENSRLALIAGYTGGADVLEFDLQLTKDGHLVVSHDPTTDRLTGTAVRIIERSLAELRAFDFSETFRPRDSPDFRYYLKPDRRLPLETFPAILELLPDDIELLIELKHDSSLTTGRREEFVGQAIGALLERGLLDRVVVYSKDTDNLRLARDLAPDVRLAAFDFAAAPAERLALLKSLPVDGLVTDLESVMAANALTDFGRDLERVIEDRGLRVGAVLYPQRQPGVFTEPEWRALRDRDWVWSVSTDSMFDVAFTRRSVTIVDEAFAGDVVDRERFSLGYAKANKFGHVFQKDGIHVEIKPYPSFLPLPVDPLELRLDDIETTLTFVAKDWPYYSGGGLGFVPGIRGDFSAEVDYTVDAVGQATTLEMAVLNVDPGAHQGKIPTSFREKDSFFDPHGAPPYVGVEHDEDDGYRINWNLGSEYDNNQYGPPVGDGRTPRAGRLRLERRGPYFAAYYRNDIDARNWVCCGIVRNYSLNSVVFLRCVGKRWRQEKDPPLPVPGAPRDPANFMPVIPNHFVFRRLKVQRHLNR